MSGEGEKLLDELAALGIADANTLGSAAQGISQLRDALTRTRAKPLSKGTDITPSQAIHVTLLAHQVVGLIALAAAGLAGMTAAKEQTQKDSQD